MKWSQRSLTIAMGILAVVAAPAIAEPLTAPDVLQGRDLSKYDTAGDYSASEPIDSSRYHGKIPRITALRRFISEHWHGRRRGYATLTESGIDTVWTTHIFVEPRNGGGWHIVLRTVRRQLLEPPVGGTPFPDRVGERPEARVLEDITRKKGDAPGGRVLVFQTVDGKESWRL